MDVAVVQVVVSELEHGELVLGVLDGVVDDAGLETGRGEQEVVEVKDFDEGLINVLNDSYGTSYGSHEADVGGSTFLGGIRWHF